ncbi:WD40-repeat-containing domain protein [Melampsora americana]|nr:WD40-repeat-containing domain protein [Melampsora americana]
MASLISSTIWIRKGVAAQFPRRYDLNEKEMERVTQMAGDRLEQVKQELAQAQFEEEKVDIDEMIGGESDEEDNKKDEGEDGDKDWTDEDDSPEGMDVEMEDVSDDKKVEKIADELAEYNLENYDQETTKSVSMGVFSNVKGLQYYDNPSDDPYVTLNDLAEDDELEREELEIYPTDSVLVSAKTQDDVSQLDVYVYDASEENFYVHHDLLLPAMPLCLEWIDFTPAGIHTDDPDRKGNFVAVGTMDPEIEIWSLDVIDGLYPDAILGATNRQKVKSDEDDQAEEVSEPAQQVSKKKKKKKKAASHGPTAPASLISPTHHTSSILSLSHNRMVRNLLLSSSADTTVKLWDLNVEPVSPASTFTAIRSFDLHKDKVQSAQWNPKQPTVVLSGGWDGLIKIWDSRNCAEGVGVKVESDVECLRWDPFEDFVFLVTLDNGLIQSYDSRMLPKFGNKATDVQDRSKALWTLSAHDSSVSALDMSSTIPGLMVTGGVDKMVKVWNVDQKDGKPSLSMVTSRDLGVGKVFSVSFCPDEPATIAVAGSKASVQLWDLTTNNGVRSGFRDRLKQFTNFNVDEERTVGKGGVISVADEPQSEEE